MLEDPSHEYKIKEFQSNQQRLPKEIKQFMAKATSYNDTTETKNENFASSFYGD